MGRFKHCAYIYQRDGCCCFDKRRTLCCPFLTRSGKCCWNVQFYFNLVSGEQWFSGRVPDSRPRGRGFEPHIHPSLALVQPRKTGPCLTERLLMGRKESNQTKSSNKKSIFKIPIIVNLFFEQIALLVCGRSSSPLSQPSKYVSKQLAVYKVVKTCIFYPRT